MKRLPGFIKGIAYSDGDNSYYPIAIQHDTVEESEAGYKQLLESLWNAFPHTATAENAYGSDRDSGLLAYVRTRRESGQPVPNFIYCTVHIKRNVRKKYSGDGKQKIRDRAIASFDKIAYCKRQDQTENRLALLSTKMKDFYDYLMEIGPANFCDSLMTGVRPEKLTSNSIESLWSHTKQCRAQARLPLFFRDIYNFAISKIVEVEKKMLRLNDSDDFTPYACEHMEQRLEWGEEKKIKIQSSFNHQTLTATMADGKGRISSVNLNADNSTKMTCTCQARLFQRIPCACLMVFVTQTRNHQLLHSRIHPSFLYSSWAAALKAAIAHETFSASSSSTPAFQRILPIIWDIQSVPATAEESFLVGTEFGSSRGQPGKLPQDRRMDIAKPKGKKRKSFYERIARTPGSDVLVPERQALTHDSIGNLEDDDLYQQSQDNTVISTALEDDDIFTGPSQEIYPHRTRSALSSSLDFAPDSGKCTGCAEETTNLHGCVRCGRPTHVWCGGRTLNEDGFDQRVICKDCCRATSPHFPSNELLQPLPNAATSNLTYQNTARQDTAVEATALEETGPADTTLENTTPQDIWIRDLRLRQPPRAKEKSKTHALCLSMMWKNTNVLSLHA